jgi:hypothetical protein
MMMHPHRFGGPGGPGGPGGGPSVTPPAGPTTVRPSAGPGQVPSSIFRSATTSASASSGERSQPSSCSRADSRTRRATTSSPALTRAPGCAFHDGHLPSGSIHSNSCHWDLLCRLLTRAIFKTCPIHLTRQRSRRPSPQLHRHHRRHPSTSRPPGSMWPQRGW